jgi:hypothetical protein
MLRGYLRREKQRAQYKTEWNDAKEKKKIKLTIYSSLRDISTFYFRETKNVSIQFCNAW